MKVVNPETVVMFSLKLRVVPQRRAERRVQALRTLPAARQG
jgi:hypothetical protein